jgi:hypothetical protein
MTLVYWHAFNNQYMLTRNRHVRSGFVVDRQCQAQASPNVAHSGSAVAIHPSPLCVALRLPL